MTLQRSAHCLASYGFRLTILGLALLLAGSFKASAQGKLDAFERDASAPTPSQPAVHRPGSAHHHEDRGSHISGSRTKSFYDTCMDCVSVAVMYGGACSWERISGLGDEDVTVAPRYLGDPLLPFARIDIVYQDLVADVTATELRIEEGYGPFALHLNWTSLREESPKDNLDITRLLAMYRMSFGSHTELDLGCGPLSVNGEQNTITFAFSMPILIHPVGPLGLEFRPTWSSGITDYDLALMLTWRYTSLKAGYRWLSSTHESLEGPYIGLSFRL